MEETGKSRKMLAAALLAASAVLIIVGIVSAVALGNAAAGKRAVFCLGVWPRQQA